MFNPNFSKHGVDLRDVKPTNLEDFDFSNIVWGDPISDDKAITEAEIEIKIADKEYLCKLKKRIGYVIQEIIFELFDRGFKDCVLEGQVLLSMDTEAFNAIARAGIERNSNKEERLVLPDGTGMIFYKKILDYIRKESQKYTHGLLHKEVHDPRMGLSPEKWNQIFAPLLVERGYQKIKEGEWHRLYIKEENK
jgi:hypothetical protein